MEIKMSRELNAQQKAMILEEVKRNIQQGSNNELDKLTENHYKISTDTYFKCMELNDHETYHQNVEHYLYELKEEEYKKTYMAKEFGYDKK